MRDGASHDPQFQIRSPSWSLAERGHPQPSSPAKRMINIQVVVIEIEKPRRRWLPRWSLSSGLAEGGLMAGYDGLEIMAVSGAKSTAFTPAVHIQSRFRSRSYVVPRRGHHARNARMNWEGFAGLQRIGEPPIEPEKMDVGDRIAAHRPAVSQTPVGNSPDLAGMVSPCRRAGCTVAAAKDIHDSACASASISSRGNSSVSETFRQIKQDRGDLGKRAPVDDQRGDLAFRIERQVSRRAHVSLFLKRHRPPVEGDADLVQRNVHCHPNLSPGRNTK